MNKSNNKQNLIALSSFRCYPELYEKLKFYASAKKRSLTSQLDIVFDRYLETMQSVEVEKNSLNVKKINVCNIKPTSFRTPQAKLKQIQSAAVESQQSMSLWINHAIDHCLSEDMLEP